MFEFYLVTYLFIVVDQDSKNIPVVCMSSVGINNLSSCKTLENICGGCPVWPNG